MALTAPGHQVKSENCDKASLEPPSKDVKDNFTSWSPRRGEEEKESGYLDMCHVTGRVTLFNKGLQMSHGIRGLWCYALLLSPMGMFKLQTSNR